VEQPYYEFLTAFAQKHGNIEWHNRPENERAVVCLEGTARWFFPTVLRNFRYFLGEGWNLYLFHTEYAEPFIEKQIGNWKIQRFKVNHPRINAHIFNVLCKDVGLWSAVKEENVLVIEADTIACKPWSDEWLKWDMIGAPCGEQGSIYNGGLSLRKRSKMVEALRRFDTVLIDEQEDIFFTKALRMMGARLPDGYDAARFSVENEYFEQPFGLHGTDKAYLPLGVAEKIVRQIEF
jgi:hypothetical protein